MFNLSEPTWTILPAVESIDEEADHHPDRKPDPGLPGELGGEEHVDQDGDRRQNRNWY